MCFVNVLVYEVVVDIVVVLVVMVECIMCLQVIIQDGDIWIVNDVDNVYVQFEMFKVVDVV